MQYQDILNRKFFKHGGNMKINKLIKMILVLLINIVMINSVLANPQQHYPYEVVVYRSNQVTRQDLVDRYGVRFQEIADLMKTPLSFKSKADHKRAKQTFESIKSDIKKSGDFEYVHVTVLLYPQEQKIYFNVDLVDKHDKARMPKFTDKYNKNIPDKYNLIPQWQAYEKSGMDISFKEKNPSLFKSCSAFHCLFGFEHQKLAKYENIFNSLVPKEKSDLIQILKSDKDPFKRKSAAFLLAHIKDGRELIKILTPSIQDIDEGVRNNVTRVLGLTFQKVKDADFPIDQVVKMLDSPYFVDRNKALMLAASLGEQPKYANYLRAHAKKELMDELRLSAINNNHVPYGLLRTISGKTYAENDYRSWENWLNQKND